MKPKGPPKPPEEGPFNNPFGALKGKLGELPKGAPPPKPGEPKAPAGPPRAVVRMERKGRGGKEVTVVEQLALPPAELEKWCKQLKQALGCGGTIEGSDIVLQGDHRQRVMAELLQRGVKKVSVG